jgi:hypothetical protein
MDVFIRFKWYRRPGMKSGTAGKNLWLSPLLRALDIPGPEEIVGCLWNAAGDEFSIPEANGRK